MRENVDRKSNFELLRIISMFMIIMGHMMGQAFDVMQLKPEAYIFEMLFCRGARISVNLFLMMGIWFMIDSEFKASKVLKLYGALWFYSVFITLGLFFAGKNIGIKMSFPLFFHIYRTGCGLFRLIYL